MKVKILIFATLLLLFVGCSRNQAEVTIPQNTSGNYIGIFERNGTSSNVQLNLNNGTFNGPQLARASSSCPQTKATQTIKIIGTGTS